jgi:hypothetical protein
MTPRPREHCRRPIRWGISDAELATFRPGWTVFPEAWVNGYGLEPPPDVRAGDVPSVSPVPEDGSHQLDAYGLLYSPQSP